MALDCWRKHMIEPMKEKLIKLILDSIDRDRKGESVNQAVIHGVINSLVDVADKRQKTLVVSSFLFTDDKLPINDKESNILLFLKWV